MLDTSTVILLGRLADPDELPNEAVTSAITLAELSVRPHVVQTDAGRSARQQHLQQAEAEFEIGHSGYLSWTYVWLLTQTTRALEVVTGERRWATVQHGNRTDQSVGFRHTVAAR